MGQKAGTKGEKENKGRKNERKTLRRHNILRKPEHTQRVPASNNGNLTFVVAVPQIWRFRQEIGGFLFALFH